MKFLLYSDVHLNYCLGVKGPFVFDYYHNLFHAIRREMGVRPTKSALDDAVLHRVLQDLSIVNVRARELGCDLVVNLGDTFGSSRYFDKKHVEEERYQARKKLSKKDFDVFSSTWNDRLCQMDLFLNKHNGLIREVLKDHVIVSGNNDPFILPEELRNGITYIDRPTVMFDKYLFVPMSWEEGGKLSKRAQLLDGVPGREENLKAIIENPEAIEIVFAHDPADYNQFELSHSVQAKKLFHGHTHRRKIPKRATSKNVCVGAFFEYYTGFITYDDVRNEIKTYNAQGEEVNQAEEMERYRIEQERNHERAEDEKMKAINSYSQGERKQLINSTNEYAKKLMRTQIVEYRKKKGCTELLSKEQLDKQLETQILLRHYVREYKRSMCR